MWIESVSVSAGCRVCACVCVCACGVYVEIFVFPMRPFRGSRGAQSLPSASRVAAGGGEGRRGEMESTGRPGVYEYA